MTDADKAMYLLAKELGGRALDKTTKALEDIAGRIRQFPGPTAQRYEQVYTHCVNSLLNIGDDKLEPMAPVKPSDTAVYQAVMVQIQAKLDLLTIKTALANNEQMAEEPNASESH